MTESRTSPPVLKQRRLGVASLVFFTISAAAPLTVLAGGMTTIFAVTGILGAPLSFLVIAAALALFAVGYSAMSRHITNAGAFYAYIANGVGRIWAVASSFVALLSYNAIQIGLYGMAGLAVQDFAARHFGVAWPWWLWAVLTLAVVATLGVLRADLNAAVLAVLLTLECLAVVLYDIGAITHPAGNTISVAGLDPANLIAPGLGAVFAFAVATFIGFESGAIYSEECREPNKTVARATYATLTVTGLLYALSAWAMTVTVGTDGLQQAAALGGPSLVFDALAAHWSPLVADIANVLFLTSVLAALLSFHNGIARYLFALGRERVLPASFSRVGGRSGAPIAGSIAQTVLALVIVVVFAVAQADPLLQLFTWGGGLAGAGVLLLMVGTSVAVVGFFRRQPKNATRWQRVVAPALAAVVLSGLLVLVVINFGTLLGPDSPAPLRWLLPGLVAVSAVAGGCWALYLRRAHPQVYRGIGGTAHLPRQEDLPTELVPHN